MKNLESSVYPVWRPDLPEIMHLAIAQKSMAKIHCHYPLDECNKADLTLTGNFIKLTDYQAQFIVNDFDLDPGNNFPHAPECDYSFAVNFRRGEAGKNRFEYGGRALILDQELQRNNIPEGLLLRMSQPARIRPLRRYERANCSENTFYMPGLMLVGPDPIGRRQLLNVLGHYYQQKSRPKPRLVNISAGGVCLETEDPHCLRLLGADESYLFFFFSGDRENLKCPSVFIGKKVGIFRGQKSRHTGLRIRFLREMVWTDPMEELKWLDIENEGSATIRKLLKTSH